MLPAVSIYTGKQRLGPVNSRNIDLEVLMEHFEVPNPTESNSGKDRGPGTPKAVSRIFQRPYDRFSIHPGFGSLVLVIRALILSMTRGAWGLPIRA